MDYDDSDDNEIELVWRYSSKKNENKLPKFKKSYTLIEHFYNNYNDHDDFINQKFSSQKQKSAPAKSKTQSRYL
jgi:hypothetical protein